MYDQRNDPYDRPPPPRMPYDPGSRHQLMPSLSHGSTSAPYPNYTGLIPSDTPRQDGRYGHITLRPHSSLPQPQLLTPPSRLDPTTYRTSGGVKLGLIADDRDWPYRYPAYQTMPNTSRNDILRGRSLSPQPNSYSPIPASRHSAGASRVVSPIPLSRSSQSAPYPHGPSLPSTFKLDPPSRSWTLDSPSRSSLAHIEPTHSNRPLTRSPLLRPESADVSASGYWDGGEGTDWGVKRETVGPPPKAKLGGPGGKTYEERRAGDSRIVSAPARTPPVRRRELSKDDAEVEGMGSRIEDAKWGNKIVAVRLPTADASAAVNLPLPPSTAASTRASPEPRESSSWPAYNVDATSSGTRRRGSPSDALDIESRRGSVAQANEGVHQPREKNVVVTVPQGDGWRKLTAGEKHRHDGQIRREAMEGVAIAGGAREQTSGKRNRSPAETSEIRAPTFRDNSATRHSPYPSISSSQAAHLSASALPFIPSQASPNQSAELSAQSTATPVKLRPAAPPFEPSTYSRRVVTTPIPFRNVSPHLNTRRSFSDVGGEGPAKRLRGNAPPFQPGGSASGHASQMSGLSASNPYSDLWLPAKADEQPAGEKSDYRAHPHILAPSTSKQPETTPTRIPKSTAFQFGTSSPSPSSADMKRTASGKLRPAAASFVPTGEFTFRPSAGPVYPSPASHSTGCSIGSSVSGAPLRRGTAGVESTEPADMPLRAEHNQSPASRLHDVFDADAGVDRPGDGVGEVITVSEAEEEGAEILERRYRAEMRSAAPSPPSNLLTRGRSPAGHRMGEELGREEVARPYTEYVPVSSTPPLQASQDSEDSATSINITPDAGPSDIFTPVIPTSPQPPPSAPAAASRPCTPVASTNPALHTSTTTEPYETADGSPLIPRRYLDTPATPHKTTDVEAQIPTLLSPTPARRVSGSSVLEPRSDCSSDTIRSDPPGSSTPLLQAEAVEVGMGATTRFRDWIYPASPTGVSEIRRCTSPGALHGAPSLAGIASTAPAEDDTPVPSTSLLSGSEAAPALSTRTSVEFPLRKPQLIIANAEPSEEAEEEATARPSMSRLPNTKVESRVLLEKIAGMLEDIRSRQDVGPRETRAGDGEVKLGEQLAGMIAEMRSSWEDRHRLGDSHGVAPELQRELLAQRELLVQLLDHTGSSSATGISADDSGRLNTAISTLIAGQTALLEQVRSGMETQGDYARDAQAAVEAIRSIKEDLELRKGSEEKKDEVIDALREQAEEARAAEVQVRLEKDQLGEMMEELEGRYEREMGEKEDMMARVQDAEEGRRKAEMRADELEAGRMALLAERDGLAEGLRESFVRQREADSEVDKLQTELDLARAKSAMESSQPGVETRQVEALAASSKVLQDDLLAEVEKLSREVAGSAQAGIGEVKGLREDKRALQNEVTELRKKTYDAASKIADADLRLATATNAASSVESDLRRSLAAADKAKAATDERLAELEAGTERLKVEKLNLSAMATERSGAMRIMEIRHQALVQENVFWREFVLSYDRREHRRYTQSQPFHRPPTTTSSEVRTPVQQPIDRKSEMLHTPTNPTRGEDKGVSGLDDTPDLTMSTSTSAEGFVHVARTPGKDDGREEGTWWGVDE